MTATLTKGSGLKGPDLRREGSALSRSVWRGKLGELRNSFLDAKGGKFIAVRGKKDESAAAPSSSAGKGAAKKGRAKAASRGKK